MSTDTLEQLSTLIGQAVSIDAADQEVVVRFDSNADAARQFADLLQEIAAGQEVDSTDYSAYFEAVTGSALFKPGNPALAVRQVAKAYDVNAEALLKAFKAR